MRGKRAKTLRAIAAKIAPDKPDTEYKIQRFQQPRKKLNADGSEGIELIHKSHVSMEHCQRRVTKRLKKLWKHSRILPNVGSITMSEVGEANV